jgi:predicted dehydrogenase
MKTTRRKFLKNTAIGAAAPMILSSSILGRAGAVSPSERITLACIGVGGMGTGNLRSFLQDERVQVVAVCDVDSNHRRNAAKLAGLKDSDVYTDFREIVERADIDTVMIATPDHWHSLITTAIAKSGKDMYCEKPLAASIQEGRFVSDLIKKKGRILQCGTWRRSGIHTRKACELVRNGYIGDLKSIEVGVPGKFAIRGGYTGLEKPESVPPELDYTMWLGPNKDAPYTASRCHFNFRWVNDYAPGYITDWGAHFLDVSQWGHGSDLSTPIEVSAHHVLRRDKGLYDAPESFDIDYLYADGVRMKMFSTVDTSKWGIKFIGSEGWVFTENEKLLTSPKSLLRIRLKDSDTRLYVSNNHHRNFIDCVKSRNDTAAPVETAHRSASCCHIGTVSAALGRGLEYDPKTETFPGDEEANRFLMRPMKSPWKLEA